MYSINDRKFQNTPRNDKGIASAGEKRSRLDSSNFEDESVSGRIGMLHPTKGWRSRNLRLQGIFGQFTQKLTEMQQQSYRMWQLNKQERLRKAEAEKKSGHLTN